MLPNRATLSRFGLIRHHSHCFGVEKDIIMEQHVLCIARDDLTVAPIFLNVKPHGASPLDVTLLATEGENPYIAKCQC